MADMADMARAADFYNKGLLYKDGANTDLEGLDALANGVAFSVLPTDDRWFGVTYREDKPAVVESFRQLIAEGVYREDLYSDL